MNMKIGFKRVRCAAVLLIGLMAAVLAPPKVAAQVTPNQWQTLTNIPSAVLTATTSNINTGIISLTPGRGLAIMPYFATTNASGSNVVFNFQVSADGTNYSTTSPLSMTVPNNGTTAVRAYTNFPPEVLDNVRYLRLGTIQNVHTATVFISNIVASVSY